MMTTPQTLTGQVIAFCGELCPGSKPVYLPLKAEPGAQIDQCYVNVAEKMARNGGGVQYGWMVWEWKGVLLEAAFHAVWITEGGELVDITPKQDGEQRILFVPDPVQKYQNRAIPSRMKPLRDDQNIAQYIEACGEWHDLLGRYSDKTGSPEVPFVEAAPVKSRMARYREEIEEAMKEMKRTMTAKERADERRRQKKR